MTLTSTSCSTLGTTTCLMYSSASIQPSTVWGNFIRGEMVTGGSGGACCAGWGCWEGWDGDSGTAVGVRSADGAGLVVCVSLQMALFIR